MQHLATVIFRIHHIRAGNPDSGRAMAKILGNPGDRLDERPILQGVCASRRRQRSWQHCQQLGDFLRVAGGVGSDAATWQALRARRLLWPSDGAAHGVPLVELRPEAAAVPLDVLLRATAEALHHARDVDDDLEEYLGTAPRKAHRQSLIH